MSEADSLEGMKILYINEAYFKLPDDFIGNKEDALVMYAEYAKSHRHLTKLYDTDDTDAYYAFVELYPFDERKASSRMAIEVIKDGVWVEQQDSL